MWDLTAPGRPAGFRVRGPIKGWYGVRARTAGRWLLTGADDRWVPPRTLDTVLLWDLDALGTPPRLLTNPGGSEDVAFSSDGDHLLMGAQLWHLTADDPASSRVELPIVGDESGPGVTALAISPNGRWAFVSKDGSISRYPLDVRDLLALADAAASRNLTPAEWSELFLPEPFRKVFARLP